MLLALLQPAPETYELFDDILLLSEGSLPACFLTGLSSLVCSASLSVPDMDGK